jgi:hypothetical protein
MAQFKYTHSIKSAFTLSDGKDYSLFEGETYELPADNEHIKSLVAQGYLTPIETKPKQTKPTEK